MAKVETRRFRLNVPETDAAVLAWMDAQANMSASVRELVRREVARSGVTDVFSSEVPEEGFAPKRKRGQRRQQTRTQAPARTVQQAAPEPAPAVQEAPAPAPVKRAIATRRKSKPKTGGGIQLAPDSLSEFGVDLDFGDEAEDMPVDAADAAFDEISAMMGEG